MECIKINTIDIDENKLELYKSVAENIIKKYELGLNCFSKTELECASFVFCYMRFNVRKSLNNTNKEIIIKEEINNCKYLCEYFGIDNEVYSLSSIMENVQEKAKSVLKYLDDLKKELKASYKLFNCNLFHISSENFEKIKKSVNQVNMYNNQIGDLLFASSDLISIYLYLCRACGIKMYTGIENIAIYAKSPFKYIKDNIAELAKPVWIYSLPLEYFKPVMDFISGSNKYTIKFNHEWISENDNMSTTKIKVSQISLDKIKQYSIYQCNGGIKTFEIATEELNLSKDKINTMKYLIEHNIFKRVL